MCFVVFVQDKPQLLQFGYMKQRAEHVMGQLDLDTAEDSKGVTTLFLRLTPMAATIAESGGDTAAVTGAHVAISGAGGGAGGAGAAAGSTSSAAAAKDGSDGGDDDDDAAAIAAAAIAAAADEADALQDADSAAVGQPLYSLAGGSAAAAAAAASTTDVDDASEFPALSLYSDPAPDNDFVSHVTTPGDRSGASGRMRFGGGGGGGASSAASGSTAAEGGQASSAAATAALGDTMSSQPAAKSSSSGSGSGGSGGGESSAAAAGVDMLRSALGGATSNPAERDSDSDSDGAGEVSQGVLCVCFLLFVCVYAD